MTAKTALKRIFSIPRTSGAPSLEPMRELMHLLGDPQNSLRFVHIAGTNGKGSTATMTAAILQASGLTVGLYTSPYINDFRERFRIGGVPAAIGAFTEAARSVFAAMGKMKHPERLAQFDVVTAIGFLIFARANCDIVVLECGLGGRFDATNIIAPPLAAVICNIGYDHTDLLGDTVEKIAAEKCGILKSGTDAFIMAPQDYPETVTEMRNRAVAVAVPTVCVSADDITVEKCSFGSMEFSYKENRYTCSLIAAYQARNAATAIETALALRPYFNISNSAISYGLAHSYIPARLELLSFRPQVLLDGAHNPDGVRALRESMEKLLADVPYFFCLIGMLEDKDVHGALEYFFASPIIREKICGIATVAPPSPRAMSAEKLAEVISTFGLPEKVHIVPFDDTRGGLYAVLKDLRANEVLICFGSLYMMGDLRRYVNEYYLEHKGEVK